MINLRRLFDFFSENFHTIIGNPKVFKSVISNKLDMTSKFNIPEQVAMPTYLTTSLNLHTHLQSVLISIVSLVAYLCVLPIGGVLADKIGILRQIIIASMLYLLFSYACFSLIPRLDIIGCMTVLIGFAIIQALLNSALPAFMIAQFQISQRGKALAISYNISLTIFAGLMPYLLLRSDYYVNPGFAITICAMLSIIVIYFLKGKRHDYI